MPGERLQGRRTRNAGASDNSGPGDAGAGLCAAPSPGFVLNDQLSTINHQRSTLFLGPGDAIAGLCAAPSPGFVLNDQLSTLNHQHSTINHQRSTINDQRSTINDQLCFSDPAMPSPGFVLRHRRALGMGTVMRTVYRDGTHDDRAHDAGVGDALCRFGQFRVILSWRCFSRRPATNASRAAGSRTTVP